MKIMNMILYTGIVIILTAIILSNNNTFGYHNGYEDGKVDGWSYVASLYRESHVVLGTFKPTTDINNSTIIVIEPPRPSAISVEGHDLTFSNITFCYKGGTK